MTDTKETTEKNKSANVSQGAQSGLSRRGFLKASAAITTAPLILKAQKSEAQVLAPEILPSPSTAGFEWTIELPVRPPLAQTALNNPAPTVEPNLAAGECGRDNHQGWPRFYDDAVNNNLLDTYEIRVREAQHTFTLAPTIPDQPIWGYNGIYPGPTIHARYGRPAFVRIHNELPQNHVGFGTPEITTHLHNLHGASESDGFPGDFYSEIFAGPTLTAPGKFKDHFYYNAYAGFESMPATAGGLPGDPNEAQGTQWFHDHTMDATAANVYKGLAAFYLLFDELDSGNENDPNRKALRLPSGAYDIPIVIQDKRFDANGQLFWDQLSPEGIIGDKVVVNGVIQPRLSVEPRKYRFRILNGGPTRSYELYFIRRNATKKERFWYIANDGNLLEKRLHSRHLRNYEGTGKHGIRIGVAERHDIVFDFSRFPLGTEILLINRLKQDSTRKPEKKLLSTRGINTNLALRDHQLMLIKVDKPLAAPDNSRVKWKLRPMTPTPTDLSGIRVRTFEFERNNGVWTIDGKIFDATNPRVTVKRGSAEIWELQNNSGGWTHPIHIHLEEGRILSRTDSDGEDIPLVPQERGRKDVYVLHPGHTARVFLRFRDYVGKYPMHCHNLIHEDHHMMLRWDVEEDA